MSLSELASACRIQKTYLSRVFNRDGHLNADQLHLASHFLRLRPKEVRYLELIHEAERSSLPDRKESFLKEARKLQAKALHTENYIQADLAKTRSSALLRYHLNPTLQLIHLFLTIPRYAKNPVFLEKELAITSDELKEFIRRLAELGLISRADRKWVVNQQAIHLSRDSEIYPIYRILLRTKALERLQRADRQRDYSFSVLFSADQNTRKLVQEKFMIFLKTIEPAVKKANPEHVYQMNFDLLAWSEH